MADYSAFYDCMGGPDAEPAPLWGTADECLAVFDANADTDVDVMDLMGFLRGFSGSE